MTDQLCINGCNKPRAPRYRVCQKCRHGKPVPCPTCTGLKRPESIECASCKGKHAIGPKHSCWKGGRIIDQQGYVRVYTPNDPRANCGRYMREHILVIEKFLGRQLVKGETVHHKNGNRTDNRLENLELWNSSHPSGQRVSDLIKWAKEILAKYEGFKND